jgi:hypothetical protein
MLIELERRNCPIEHCSRFFRRSELLGEDQFSAASQN